MQNDWKHCYRLRASLRNLGMVGTAFMVGMTFLSVAAWLRQPANDPIKMPLVISGFLLFACLYVYFLLLYHKYRLFVGDSWIRQTGILHDKHVDLSMIHELKWRCIPQSGSVRLIGNYGELTIELGHLETQDRLQLIDFLRLTIAESKQVGWHKFNDQFANTPDRQNKSIRAEWLFALIFGAHAVAFGTIWGIGGGIQFLVYCVINVGIAVYLLRLSRQKTVGLGRETGEQSHARECGSDVF
ncbi:MAG: hypothetical protein R3E01_36710 [Pirellulaceae bacterium]